MDRYPYLPEQMNKVVQMVAHPVLAYSGPLANWTFKDLQDIEHQWGLMHKRAWHLTEGHNSAPFLLPPEEGWVQVHTPSRVIAKAAVELATHLVHSMDGEIM